MKQQTYRIRNVLAIGILICGSALGAPGDAMLEEYFRAETRRLADACLTDVQSLEDWQARKDESRKQLQEMLGLWPWPPRTDLRAAVTGKTEQDTFTVENLHFESMPGLYVTANLYVPKGLTERAPAILYVCGHGPVITNGISYGNKVAYQHHGAWFARHGYVCLIIDTLQLGEIQGIHHGTYREKMWWWNSRGYTPAGVEAWNSIRALDYLETRPEVDPQRFGVTGRSGGGAYSWWTAALDERVKVAAPVAGITDLQNHVVDGVVEGHCDCMFVVNTYRWDYPQVAALVAPRPLLIVNTDSDTIFPLDGVYRTFSQTRRIYELHKAKDKIGLVLGPGPHKDTQDLQVPVFRWFNRHLKGTDSVIETAAVKLFTPQQLRVFQTLPADAVNTNIQESFVPAAQHVSPPQDKASWAAQRDAWKQDLKQKTFGGWPRNEGTAGTRQLFSSKAEGLTLSGHEYESQPGVRLELFLLTSDQQKEPGKVTLKVLGDGEGELGYATWRSMMGASFEDVKSADGKTNPEAFSKLREQVVRSGETIAWMTPRGIGASAWTGNDRKLSHIRRRFMLLGQTLDGMRVWDIRQAAQALARITGKSTVSLQAKGDLAVDAIYAAIFGRGIRELELWNVPASHRDGPDLLNVLRIFDVPHAVAIAADTASLRLHVENPDAWSYTRQLTKLLGQPCTIDVNKSALSGE